jgi:non-homologous end joining protein Ku
MAPRANWNGYLKLSLVSCAVALFPGTTTRDRVRFNVINRETGNRVRYNVVDADTGEEVPQEERVKGYQVDGDGYVLLEEKELDDVALESTHTVVDRYETALQELIAAKQAGKKPPTSPAPRPSNVVSLMDALRRSVQSGRGASSSDTRRSKAHKRAAPRRAAPKRKKLKRAS